MNIELLKSKGANQINIQTTFQNISKQIEKIIEKVINT